ncbi:MAG: HD domain-containing phosphohydrolase, partial [Myxococcota bacterium]
ILSRKLDRVVFVAYFLGAVVPLVALGVVIDSYQLAALADPVSAIGLLGLVGSICLLSLSSFFMLRRMTYRSLAQMDQDKRRAARLLRASSAFAASPHADEAVATAARSALALTNARAVFVFLRSRPERPLAIGAAAGADASDLFESLQDPLVELANIVISDKRPAICNREDRGKRSPDSGITAVVAVPLADETVPLGVLTAIHTDSHGRFDADQVDSLLTLADLTSVALRNADLRDCQSNFFSHVTDILVKALDAHLNYHGGHGKRVAFYANLIGRELKLDDPQMRRLHFAALLHDIGMLHIESSIRHHSKACEKHPLFGSRILARIRLWEEIAPIVLHHHERFDGTGYPERLSGSFIPLESRIIALCDALDSMTASSSYKVAVEFGDAVREIEEGAGTQFDPEIVHRFVRLVRRGAIGPGTFSSPLSGSEGVAPRRRCAIQESRDGPA